MSAPEPVPDRKARFDVEERRAFRLVHEAVYSRVWLALARHGIPVRAHFEDRHDVAQDIVLAAYRRWTTYRDDLGAPEAWLGGIILNEVRAHRRRLAKQPVLTADNHEANLVDQAQSADERLHFHQLRRRAHELYNELDPDVRRVFIAHEFDGLTFAKIAVIEEISTTRAFQIHAQAVRELQAAVARREREQRRHGVFPLPLALAGYLEADRVAPDVPREQQELARRRAEDALGFARSPEAPSAPQTRAPAGPGPLREGVLARLAHPRVSRPVMTGLVVAHLLGLVGIAALGGLLIDDLSHLAGDSFHEDPVPVVSVPGAGASAQVPPLAASVTPSAAPSTAAAPLPSTAPVDPRSALEHTEEQAFNTASSALARGDVSLALAELARHAERFPAGRHALERESLWISALLSTGRTAEACARAASFRRAYPRSTEARVLARMNCPGSPGAR